MDTPTAEQIRARSELLSTRFPFDADADPDALDVVIAEAVPAVMALTSRRFDDVAVDAASPLGCPWEAIPAYLEPVALRAVAARAEQLVIATGRRARQSELASGNLREQHAGPWGESYFGPDDAAKLKRLDRNALVHDALWALATACAQRVWLALWGEKVEPAGAVKGFNYGRRSGGY